MSRRDDDRLQDILTVEVGDISFFAPPDAASQLDASSGVLAVTYTPGRGVWRLIGFDGPRLFTLRGQRERAEGRVLVVTPDREKIAAVLGRQGDRPAAALLGTGPYAIARHDHHNTHLVWSLTIPRGESPVLHDAGISLRSTSLLVVKNPDKAKDDGHQRPQFHDWIMQRFEGRRFMEATPPEVLDFVGAEIALLATADDVVSGMGIAEPEGERRDPAVDALLGIAVSG